MLFDLMNINYIFWSVNNNNNAHINLMNIMKSGTSNNVKRPFEYLPFAVINEQSAPY